MALAPDDSCGTMHKLMKRIYKPFHFNAQLAVRVNRHMSIVRQSLAYGQALWKDRAAG